MALQWDMTWPFVFLVTMFAGLILAVVSGLLRDLTSLASHQHLVVASTVAKTSYRSPLVRCISPGVAVFGLVGLLLGSRSSAEPRATLLTAGVAGVVAVLLASVAFRHHAVTAEEGHMATVMRDIPPGGYGQVRLEHGANSFLMAARSVENEVIVAGSEVEIIDSQKSVLTVKRSSE